VADLEMLDSGTWKDRWRSHQFTSGFREIGFVAGDSDAPCFAFNRSEAAHYLGWPNGDVDEWLDKTRASTDPDERGKLFTNVVDKVVEEAPYIYTYHINVTEAQNKNLAGIPLRRVAFHLFLREAYWTA
jgi:ABC-type transport system substrate-binding protein